MLGPHVHRIDPVLADVAGMHLWWYGLGFAVGFLQIHRVLRRGHASLGLSLREVWSLSLFIVIGVLAGGRLVEIAFDEWPFYRLHPRLIPAYWLGGMATHGLMLGAAAGAGLFARVCKKPFLILADALVIPGAFLMGVGRIGNFIDGQIVGSVTNAWWAVKFPDADGFRHPVVLYDGAKNLLLMLFLLRVRRANPTPGATAARFVFWYAFPRIFIDLFRDYPTHRFVLGTGQTLNILMAALGIVLLIRSRMRRLGRLGGGRSAIFRKRVPLDQAPLASQRIALACLLVFCLTIPSNWTQDIPSRYGTRHPGLRYSRLYPRIDTAPVRAKLGPARQVLRCFVATLFKASRTERWTQPEVFAASLDSALSSLKQDRRLIASTWLSPRRRSRPGRRASRAARRFGRQRTLSRMPPGDATPLRGRASPA